MGRRPVPAERPSPSLMRRKDTKSNSFKKAKAATEISMSVLIVGSTALDSIKTPEAENPRLLGGSASHAAVAARFFSPVKLVGVVGDDFPRRYLQLYKRHRI